MNKIEYALEDFKNIQELIKFIDQKAGLLLVVYGLLFTVFLDVSKSLKLINPFTLVSSLKTIFSILCFISGASFIILSFIVIFLLIFKIIKPKKASNYRDAELCLYYFDHIANHSKQQFIRKFKALNDDKMLSDLLGQVYEVSIILKYKQDYFSLCAKLLFFSIVAVMSYVLCSNFI